jgi:hypothetical protein
MTPYKNLSGDSGVVAYEMGRDSITVEFRNSRRYVYDYGIPGRAHVEQMKALAVFGRGLSSYIAQEIKGKYARMQ